MQMEFWSGNLIDKRGMEAIDIDGRMLKWTLRELYVRYGLKQNWVRRGPSWGLFSVL